MSPLLPHGTSTGSGPLPSGNTSGLPFTANFTSGRKNEEMSLRTIIIVAVSSVIVSLGMVGIFYIIFKWRKTRRPSSDLDLQFTSSPNMRSGTVSNFFLQFTDAYIEIWRFFRSMLF
jgi:hypothetical protein